MGVPCPECGRNGDPYQPCRSCGHWQYEDAIQAAKAKAREIRERTEERERQAKEDAA